MKKIFLVIALTMLWASLAGGQELSAQQSSEAEPQEPVISEFGAAGGWYGIRHMGNTVAGEYQYLESSPAGELNMEWDPLPHRLVIESYYLNDKDYFGEIDYSFKDVVVLNGYTRNLFHNLHHYRFDDLVSAPSLSFSDLNPEDRYGIENHLNRGFIRLKTPNFPLHLYADVRVIKREGDIQQRFFSGTGFGSAWKKSSQSREIEWNTTEYRVGANSHLGPIEAEYTHVGKKFEAFGDKLLIDENPGFENPHNLVPDLESSSDTVKVHSSYSGRLALAGAYTTGDRKNLDSAAKAEYSNAAGDIMFMPITSIIFTLKYRRYELDANNPDTANRVTMSGIETINVRDSVSSTRDVVSGMLRYRATGRLTLRSEYIVDTTDRSRGMLGTILTAPPTDAPAFWVLPESTTKNTAKLGLSYRIMKKVTARADYSVINVDNPAYNTDPDEANNARASVTWMPTPQFNTMVSYGIIREKRDNLSEPLKGGSRDAARDQAFASTTLLIGKRSSITFAYSYYRNKVEQTATLHGGVDIFELEPAVPYTDTSHLGSVLVTVAPLDRLNLTGSATRSYSRGSFRMTGAGVVTNVAGISELSDMKLIDTIYSAGVEAQLTSLLQGEVRGEYRKYNDEIDDTQDGTAKLILATMHFKW